MEQLIQEVFQTKNYTIKKLNKGLSNQNYLLEIDNNKYVLRIPYPNINIINRQHEQIVSEQVKQLDCEVIYFNASSGVKISKFIENTLEFKDSKDPLKIQKCAQLIKHLHTLQPQSFSFNSTQTFDQYKSLVKQPLYDLEPFLWSYEYIKTKTYTPVLCHNDLVSGNLLFHEERMYLIDYEYAANNDPLFDVISFLGENQIHDPTLRECFYKIYFDSSPPYEELYKMEVFQNTLWCYWAMMMYEQTHDLVYQEIAADKYNALQTMR